MCLFLEVQSEIRRDSSLVYADLMGALSAIAPLRRSLPGHELHEAAKRNLEQGRKFADEGVSKGVRNGKFCDIRPPNLEHQNRIVKGVEKKTF